MNKYMGLYLFILHIDIWGYICYDIIIKGMEDKEMERKYFITGAFNTSHKQYDTLEEAIAQCKKVNRRVKHKRKVMSGIPQGDSIYALPKIEYEE